MTPEQQDRIYGFLQLVSAIMMSAAIGFLLGMAVANGMCP